MLFWLPAVYKNLPLPINLSQTHTNRRQLTPAWVCGPGTATVFNLNQLPL